MINIAWLFWVTFGVWFAASNGWSFWDWLLVMILLTFLVIDLHPEVWKKRGER